MLTSFLNRLNISFRYLTHYFVSADCALHNYVFAAFSNKNRFKWAHISPLSKGKGEWASFFFQSQLTVLSAVLYGRLLLLGTCKLSSWILLWQAKVSSSLLGQAWCVKSAVSITKRDSGPREEKDWENNKSTALAQWALRWATQCCSPGTATDYFLLFIRHHHSIFNSLSNWTSLSPTYLHTCCCACSPRTSDCSECSSKSAHTCKAVCQLSEQVKPQLIIKMLIIRVSKVESRVSQLSLSPVGVRKCGRSFLYCEQ